MEPLTKDQLKKLTLRATVALAARCARRIQPLISRARSADDRRDDPIGRAIAFAEEVARDKYFLVDFPPTEILSTADAAAAIGGAADPEDPTHDGAYAAAYAAQAALSALVLSEVGAISAPNIDEYSGAYVDRDSENSRAADPASATVVDAAHAISCHLVAGHMYDAAVHKDTAVSAGQDLFNEMLKDYSVLLGLRPASFPELGDPFNPSEDGLLGPLWPSGEPKWYSKAKSLQKEILSVQGIESEEAFGEPTISVNVSDGITLTDSVHVEKREAVSPPMLVIAWDPELLSEEEYAELVEAIGDLARAEGAVGIQRVRSEGFGVTVEEGVLQ